jgi:hypothetical protein
MKLKNSPKPPSSDPPAISLVLPKRRHKKMRCKDCGRLIYQPLPDEVKRKHCGPGILAMVVALTGMLNTSQRKALVMININGNLANIA